MLFSFLVPVYNVEKYIRQCIDSLLVQSGAKFEIVLLDDGSTDKSGIICDEYAAQYPDIIRVIHKQNEGLLLTRRRGFREARGDWFICVDSDDYVSSEMLTTVVKEINKYSCDMLMFNFDYVDHAGVYTPSRVDLPDNSVYEANTKQLIYEKKLLSVDINSMWMRVMHRSIVDIDTDYSEIGIRNMCEDAVQVLPLYTNSNRIIYVDKSLYHYRKTETSITGTMSMEKWDAIHKAFRISLPYIDRWEISESVKQKSFTKQMETICNCVRWYFIHETVDNSERRRQLQQIKEKSLFCQCSVNYNKAYASTKYCKISVPILSMLIKVENIPMLKLWFYAEQKLRR